MSKLITLSSLEYFKSKITVPDYIKNIPTSPLGNIYLDEENRQLKYKKGGEWYGIELYEEKPTENTLALRIQGVTYYAGLVDPADEVASDLRIRLNNVVYAVAREKPSGILSGGRYVKTKSTFSLGGSEDVELVAKILVNLIDPTNNRYYTGSNVNAPPYLRIYEDGCIENQSPTIKQANKQGYEWKRANTSLYYVNSRNNNVTTPFGYPSSFTSESPTFAQSETVLGIEVEYKMAYTATNNTITWYMNNEQLYVYDRYSSTRTYTGCQQNTKNTWGSGVVKNFYVAIGDIIGNNSNIQVTLNDFSVKVNGVQVLGISDLQ